MIPAVHGFSLVNTEHVQLIVLIKLLYSFISILAYLLSLDVCMRFLDECPWDRLRALRGRFVSQRDRDKDKDRIRKREIALNREND